MSSSSRACRAILAGADHGPGTNAGNNGRTGNREARSAARLLAVRRDGVLVSRVVTFHFDAHGSAITGAVASPDERLPVPVPRPVRRRGPPLPGFHRLATITPKAASPGTRQRLADAYEGAAVRAKAAGSLKPMRNLERMAAGLTAALAPASRRPRP